MKPGQLDPETAALCESLSIAKLGVWSVIYFLWFRMKGGVFTVDTRRSWVLRP